MKLLWKIVLICVGICLILCVCAYLFLLHILETRTLWSPRNRRPTPEPVKMIQVDEDISIACTYIPPRKKNGRVILYSYGTGCQLADSGEFARQFTGRGYGFIGYDYEGFGSSGGTATLSATLRDIDAVYDFLTTECGIKPEQIIAVGYSMGCGPSAYLASKEPIGGVILFAGFASIFQVKSQYGFWPGNKLTVSRWLAASNVPVLLIHGTDDEVVPYYNAEINYNAAQGKKELITLPGVNHWLGAIVENVNPPKFFRYLEEFF